MLEGFANRYLDRTTTSLHLPNHHRALERGQAKVRQLLFICRVTKSSFCLLSDEKGCQFVLYYLKNQIDILTYQFVVFSHFVANRTDWTTAGHVKALLQLDMSQEAVT